MRPRTLAAASRTTPAATRSRARSLRRRRRTATTTASASPSAPRNAARQRAPAHPSTVVSACATSASRSVACDATTAVSPTAPAATARRIESIVRLLRRPGSFAVRMGAFQRRSAVEVVLAALRATCTHPEARTLGRVLELTHTEREDEVPDTADDREGGDPGHEQDGTAAVVAGRPEAEDELDDAADELEPPDLDLVAGRDRDDDVERPGEDEEEAEDRGQRRERVARMDERDDPGHDEMSAR